MHAHARLNDIDNKKADDQGNGGDNLKVKKRQTACFTHFFHVFHTGDTSHDRTEDHRRNDHFDQLDEAVAKRLHHFADMRREMTEQNADHNRANHLKVQHLVNRRLFLCGCLKHKL